MRIRRVAIRHVRGVPERVVHLLPDHATTGVTVVEGPNEIGKSSLADALDVLLTCKDSSRSRQVRSLQSRGVDQGPLVEADLEAGPYRLTYRKRFLKQASTELRVHAPRIETLAGDEAHARVEAILDETVDRRLWDRLRIRQGAGSEQVALDDSRGLVARLQEQTVSDAFGDRESALFDQVRAAYREHFTDTGRERITVRSATERVRRCSEEAATLAARLDALRADVDRVGALGRELPRLRGLAREATAHATELETQLASIEALEGLVRERNFALEAARAQADAAAGAVQQRERLDTDLRATEDERAALQARVAGDQALIEDAAVAVTAAELEVQRCREHHDDARRRLETVERALAEQRRRVSLQQLTARYERARDAGEEVTELERAIERCTVDEDLLAELRSRRRALDRAEAALEAASPQVFVTASQPLALRIDGAACRLATGETRTRSVSGELELDLPEVVSVRVRSGMTVEETRQRREEAAELLATALAAAGFEDLAAAESAFAHHTALRADLVSARRRVERELGGQRLDELVAELGALRAAMTSAADLGDEAAPGTVDAAEEQRLGTAAEERGAAAALEAARCRAEDARRLHAQRSEEGLARRLARDGVERRISTLSEELAARRRERSDEALAEAAHSADAALTAAEAALAQAAAALDAAEPHALRARLGSAQVAADDAARQLQRCERERGELCAAIRAQGDEGLHERHAAALAALERARAAERAIRRRAASVQVLHGTLAAHRAAAQVRYVEPLRDEIVRLGRLLHGADFDVELDAALTVAKRRLGDLWLELDELSLGAQEQLALLARLACASLVADDAGGFLLIDDALGHTDRERLDALGAVLRIAGQHCQVVVLTCFPERYDAVGGAWRVSLR